jgi:serine/threonine-protein kinase
MSCGAFGATDIGARNATLQKTRKTSDRFMQRYNLPADSSDRVYLEDTDKPLPEKLNPNTRYMFQSQIAKGGKSIISAYKDMHLNRVVAYKTLRPEFADDEVENTRLLREARITAMLQHPNTLPIYEIGRDNRGNYYFTMKLVHGYTLREVLNFRERYALRQLINVIAQVCHALASAHTLGVVHRDIKPENILIGPYNEVLLMDWGLAKVWHKDGSSSEESLQTASVANPDKTMTGYGQLQGSICYMSPEQIQKDPAINASTDIYSIGAILYEVLAGQVPFDSDKAYEILDMVENSTPPRPSAVGKYPVPKYLEVLCMRCLQKDPADRPMNMKEIINTLEQF